MVNLEEIKVDFLEVFQNGADDPISLAPPIEMYGYQLVEEGILYDK